MFRVLGIALIVIAIALVVVPRFTDCESQGQAIRAADGTAVPMKCHWSGIAEIGVAIPMYMVGAVMTTSRRRNTLVVLSILGMVFGGLAIAFPTKLIGVCPAPTMICATVMKPALVCLGGIAAGLSGLGLVLTLPVRHLSKVSLLLMAAFTKRIVAWKGV